MIVTVPWITKNLAVCSAASSDWHQRKHQVSHYLALCEGNLLVTGGWSSHGATSNAKSISMSWCHHDLHLFAVVHKFSAATLIIYVLGLQDFASMKQKLWSTKMSPYIAPTNRVVWPWYRQEILHTSSLCSSLVKCTFKWPYYCVMQDSHLLLVVIWRLVSILEKWKIFGSKTW